MDGDLGPVVPLGMVQDMVMEAAPAPGAVLEPMTHVVETVAVVLVWRRVWRARLPGWRGGSDGADDVEERLSDGAGGGDRRDVLVPMAETVLPRGVVW